MNSRTSSTLVALALLAAAPLASAQTTPPATNSSAASAAQRSDLATLEKRAKPVLADLKLADASKESAVHAILLSHFAAMKEWHDTNDARIQALWGDFNKARSAQDQTRADAVMGRMDDVYRSFKPQHEAFLKNLGAHLAPEQIEQVKDTLTVNKVKITHNAYNEIFHGLNAEQNAFILKNLKAAREEAIDAGSMPEKSAFFKKYKIKIEAYLTTQGYDVKKCYQEFVAKQK